MKRPMEDTLAMLAGAGLGMLAMYVLDPQSGARRRRQIARTTRDALSAAGVTIAPVVGSVAETAGRTGHSIGEYASDLLETGRDYLSEASDAVRQKASDTSHHLGEHAHGWWTNGKRRLGFEPPRAAVGVAPAAAGGVGLLALGAAMAWLFDPDRGTARRHWLRDKALRLMRDVGDLCEKTGRHVGNRVYGAYAETRGAIGDDVTDRQLAERVRSHLGHVLSEMSEIEVIADDGVISLIGRAPQEELERAVSESLRVRGVRDVLSQLLPRSA